MEVGELIICAPDDPNRCQEVTGNGQCRHLALPNKKQCKIHYRHFNIDEKNKTNSYRLGIWQQRLNEFTESDQLKTLSAEIAVLKMTLEQVVASFKSETDFVIHAHTVGDLVSRIERIIQTCSNLEIKTGKMLDKATLLRLAGDIVAVISRNVTDPLLSELIANEIIDTVMVAQVTQKES